MRNYILSELRSYILTEAGDRLVLDKGLDMGTYRQLRDNIKTLMDGVERIQATYSSPRFKFKGFPAAFVVPSGNEADFLTTNDNQRMYAYKVWVFAEYDQTGHEDAYSELMECVEELVNTFDLQEDPDAESRSMADGLADAFTLLAVMASPGQFVLDEEAKLLAAQVTVRCKVSVDLTQL